ncbi:MAG: di-trans,poly-cis-decaprenylcistransferase [Gammaproteobacteria bacterium]|nr:di-trans,poly-cis-decaprenylcistransferase [Gammaproteobacteria bacterium]MBU1656099.1 di-trans,poly-cis-decaprenylcistransferase [Gammaproteobacteria bacterium]MBU1962184.1 di-trans,poly-cis-decaprenylcistransferase [Gammaproteobacteria bacterium]
MDGNGRWAKRQGKPRHAGHRAGAENLRNIVKYCGDIGIEVLTVFAFSSENWRRPKTEVALLMELFMDALKQESERLRKNNVRLRIIGDRSAFSARLQRQMGETEAITAASTGMLLQVAANYGGRWDLAQAVRRLAERVKTGELAPGDIDEAAIAAELSFADRPDPDLFIRTGGEQRLSNFVLWQSAYSELYFTDAYWPDFNEAALDQALRHYAGRQRRFGMTGEQVVAERKENTPC